MDGALLIVLYGTMVLVGWPYGSYGIVALRSKTIIDDLELGSICPYRS